MRNGRTKRKKRITVNRQSVFYTLPVLSIHRESFDYRTFIKDKIMLESKGILPASGQTRGREEYLDGT